MMIKSMMAKRNNFSNSAAVNVTSSLIPADSKAAGKVTFRRNFERRDENAASMALHLFATKPTEIVSMIISIFGIISVLNLVPPFADSGKTE